MHHTVCIIRITVRPRRRCLTSGYAKNHWPSQWFFYSALPRFFFLYSLGLIP